MVCGRGFGISWVISNTVIMLAETATAVMLLWEISNVTQRRISDAHHTHTEIRYGWQY
jgi:hypothetical protein